MKIIGYCPFGLEHQVPLLDYAGMTEIDVRRKVEDGMRREKYAGTVQQRLEELGWVIWPLALGLPAIERSVVTKGMFGVPFDADTHTRTVNRVHEWMTRVRCMSWTVRTWTIPPAGDLTQRGPDPRVAIALKEKDAYLEIVEALEKLGPDVIAAYEVLDFEGNGCVVYPDWK